MIDDASLPFAVAEYQARLGRVRDATARHGLDLFVSHIPENIYYLTAYRTPSHYGYQAVVVPHEREPFVVTRHLEERTVLTQSWIEVSVSD